MLVKQGFLNKNEIILTRKRERDINKKQRVQIRSRIGRWSWRSPVSTGSLVLT